MTRQGIIGWETNSLSGEPPSTPAVAAISGPGSSGSVSIESSIVRTGAKSLKVNPASGAAGWWEAASGEQASTDAYHRFYVRLTVLPASSRQLWGDLASWHIKINSSGTLSLFDGATSKGTSLQSLTDTTKWYRVELFIGISSQEIRIEGTTEVSASDSITIAYNMRFGSEDTVAATYTAYFDDYARDSSTFPGEGSVALLIPISDNARDTLWTGGVGGTTSLFDAVNNTPPIGTATETDLTQIEHAGGAAGTTDRYDANMTTYSTAGITAAHVIKTLYPFMWTGEDIATGNKILTFEIFSNPAVGSGHANFNVAPSSGALGTWPTGWWMASGPITSSPSVTLGTSPVMRVIRPETVSRVASVCFMGIYVEYAPVSSTRKFQRSSILGV